MSKDQAAALGETDNAQAPLDFNAETVRDLNIRSDDSANVKGGAGVVAGQAPIQNPGTIRMTIGGGTSVIIPGTPSIVAH